MLAVRFSAAGPGNCVEAAGVAYVYARTARGSFVMPAACPHRGGPLHLATLTEEGDRLVCPWHSGKIPLARLRRQIPAVRSGNTVTAILPAPPDAGTELSYRPMSAALTADPTRPDGPAR
jgi:nitrite reductase (NADH) small subunit